MSELTFDEYAELTGETAIYPGQGELIGLLYAGLGFANEAGEVAGKLKKLLRDDNGVVTEENAAGILKEIGDTMWYGARLSKELNKSLGEVAQENLDKLSDRKERGVLKGSGDTR